MKYKKIVFLLCIFLVSGTPAIAKDDGPRYCSDFYSGVKRAVISYDQKLPLDNLKWAKIFRQSIARGQKILSEAGIPAEYSEYPIPPDALLDEGVIYISLIYSFVDNDAFSIKPNHGQLVVWVKSSRLNPVSKVNISTQTRIRFLDWEYVDEMYLASAHSGLLEDAICDLAQGAMNKACSNRLDYSKNKIINLESACVPPDREFRDLEKLILENK